MPIVGDDIKSQVGATITHRVLARLFEDRGVQLDRTMQLNVGGNMDFLNMKELERLESKKVSKTQSVTSQVDREMGRDNVHIGPSDYVAWLDDRKWAYVRLEGRAFGDVPLSLEYKLEVWDSPNSAGIIIDAVRAAKLAKDRGIGGPDPVRVELLHEVPARAVQRRRGPRGGGGVHPGRAGALSGGLAELGFLRNCNLFGRYTSVPERRRISLVCPNNAGITARSRPRAHPFWARVVTSV